MLPAYEKSILSQVKASVSLPHEQQVQKMLDAFRVELLNMAETVRNNEEIGK